MVPEVSGDLDFHHLNGHVPSKYVVVVVVVAIVRLLFWLFAVIVVVVHVVVVVLVAVVWLWTVVVVAVVVKVAVVAAVVAAVVFGVVVDPTSVHGRDKPIYLEDKKRHSELTYRDVCTNTPTDDRTGITQKSNTIDGLRSGLCVRPGPALLNQTPLKPERMQNSFRSSLL